MLQPRRETHEDTIKQLDGFLFLNVVISDVLGVRAIIILCKGELLIGSGDGVVEHVKERDESHLNDDLNLRVKDPTLPMLLPVGCNDREPNSFGN